MTAYKKYIASQLEGKRVRFVCDCVIRIDITGEVVGHELSQHGEIVYKVFVPESNRTVKIGENTHGLAIEIL